MRSLGIDEVGRGCWAGPIVVGAVLLQQPLEGLADSKKLSKKRRVALAEIIEQQALAIGLGWVGATTIDKVGITAAVKFAMHAALRQISTTYDEIIIDGNYNFLIENPKSRAVIQADSSVPAVSAASIVAKVTRDNFMATLHKKYAVYEFGQHVGYGTPLHIERLKKYGICDVHRRSFKPFHTLL